MLTYKLASKTKYEAIYYYFPNGNEDAPGKIRIKSDGTREIVSESKNDLGKRFAFHALHGIDINSKTGTIAWY